MRKTLAATASAAALLFAAATPAAAAPSPRACEAPGTHVAHATVPHETEGNMRAHSRIPGHC